MIFASQRQARGVRERILHPLTPIHWVFDLFEGNSICILQPSELNLDIPCGRMYQSFGRQAKISFDVLSSGSALDWALNSIWIDVEMSRTPFCVKNICTKLFCYDDISTNSIGLNWWVPVIFLPNLSRFPQFGISHQWILWSDLFFEYWCFVQPLSATIT